MWSLLLILCLPSMLLDLGQPREPFNTAVTSDPVAALRGLKSEGEDQGASTPRDRSDDVKKESKEQVISDKVQGTTLPNKSNKHTDDERKGSAKKQGENTISEKTDAAKKGSGEHTTTDKAQDKKASNATREHSSNGKKTGVENVTSNKDQVQSKNISSVPDLVKEYIKPERLMPFYLLPIVSGLKILMQFVLLGFDLKMKPQLADEGWGWYLMDHGKNTVVSLVFALISLNTWLRDIEACSQLQKSLADHQSSAGMGSRMLMVMVLVVTSPNFVAATAIWGSLLAQGPAKALSLTPKYLAVPGLRGFPVNPFGAHWLPSAKWLYAVIVLPYVIWAIPGYCLITCLQGHVWCSLMLCRGWFGCCTCIWETCKAECCAVFSCCKWLLFGLLTLLSLGFWHYARNEFIQHWHIAWALGYFGVLQSWKLLTVEVFAGLYVSIQRWLSKSSGDSEADYIPVQHQMLEQAAVAALVEEDPIGKCLGTYMPAFTPGEPLSTENIETLISFNAAALKKDFNVEDVYLERQKKKYEDFQANKLSLGKVVAAKAKIFKAVLNQGAQVGITQVMFLCILRLTLFLRCALDGPDPTSTNIAWMFPHILIRAYESTLSERHWFTYYSYVQGLSTSSLRSASQALDALWQLI
eukprot:TRINITY_DN20216_c0_g1_i11.p1 TRINITY_DN20216_c0_g1~~TRINITY_DN20216_c0_g1_i11.p1  ORF type:complete len:639 (-),score=93.53 TRINITY_DN20216_c0_g1_i11:218-2134(-)